MYRCHTTATATGDHPRAGLLFAIFNQQCLGKRHSKYTSTHTNSGSTYTRFSDCRMYESVWGRPHTIFQSTVLVRRLHPVSALNTVPWDAAIVSNACHAKVTDILTKAPKQFLRGLSTEAVYPFAWAVSLPCAATLVSCSLVAPTHLRCLPAAAPLRTSLQYPRLCSVLPGAGTMAVWSIMAPHPCSASCPLRLGPFPLVRQESNSRPAPPFRGKVCVLPHRQTAARGTEVLAEAWAAVP